MGLGKPAAARNTDSFAGEMQTKVGAWCSQCRNQRPKNCTKAKKSEKRSTPTAADDEERSSGRKAARRERFTPGSSGSDPGAESHNLRTWESHYHSVRSMEDLSGMPIAVPVAVSMAAPPGSPRRQVAAPSAGASVSLSPRAMAMNDASGAFCVPPRSAVANPAGQHIMNEGLFGQTAQLSALAADCAAWSSP